MKTRGKSLVEQQELRELRIPPKNPKVRVSNHTTARDGPEGGT